FNLKEFSMFRKLALIATAGTLLLSATLGAAQGTRETITTANAGQLAQLMRLGRGSAEFANFTSDGSLLVVGGTVGVWLYDAGNIATENEPPVMVTQGEPRAIAVSPDGATVAVSMLNGDIVLFDIASQEQTALLDPSYG